MKISIIFLCLSISITSCQSKLENTGISKEIVVRTKLDSTKNLTEVIFNYVNKCQEKGITKKYLDSITSPLQKQLDSLTKLLNPIEYEELLNYRRNLFSELVDKEVEREFIKKNNKRIGLKKPK